MTRNGKIARLPYGIREVLNRSLRDGKSGAALLKWLNEQPQCLEVLDEEFESRPITKQNLSEWKQGGYKEWLRHEESRQRVQVLMEKAVGLEEGAGGMAIADRLGTLLAAELAVAMEQLDDIKDPKERWARMKDIARESYRLRREDHHARKLRMAEEQYQRHEKEAGRERLLDLQEAIQNKQLVASVRGGGDEARKWSDWTIRVKHGLPMPQWWTNPRSAEDWFELMTPYWWEEVATLKGAAQTSAKSKAQSPNAKAEGRGSKFEGKSCPQSKAVGLSQAKSNQKSGSVQPGQTDATESKVQGSTLEVEDKGSGAEGRVERQNTGTETVLEPAGGDACATQGTDAPRAFGAPITAENGEETVDIGKTSASGPRVPGDEQSNGDAT